MFDVICVGEMVIDFLPGDKPGQYLRNAGGAPANVAIAVARNDLKFWLCWENGERRFWQISGRYLDRK